MNKTKLFLFTLLFIFSIISKAQTDTIQLQKNAVNIYLDINDDDNLPYIKENITIVNYVRDIKNADVHVLEAIQNAANGGYEYSYIFSGNGKFKNKKDTLKFFTKADDTNDEIRQKQVKILKLGLIPYVMHSSYADNIDISFNDAVTSEIPEDKWKSWVFSLSGNAYLYGETSYKYYNFWNEISAQKVTDKIKLEIAYSNYFYKQSYLVDGEIVSRNRTTNYFRTLVAKSLGKHWAVGFNGDFGNSTYNNKKLFTGLWPTIEYNIFPYKKSSIIQLRLQYLTGPKYYEYYDTTIFDKTKELVFFHHYGLAFQIKKKWGDINSSVSGNMYFHDFSQNSLNFYNDLNIRIVKGLSLSISGSYTFIHDQFYLPKKNLSYEDILLKNIQTPTNYNFWVSFGLSYTFGSIYNNVVNPRFNDIL